MPTIEDEFGPCFVRSRDGKFEVWLLERDVTQPQYIYMGSYEHQGTAQRVMESYSRTRSRSE